MKIAKTSTAQLNHQCALKKAAGILANQKTISTILKMLIPVKRPRVPPVFEKKNTSSSQIIENVSPLTKCSQFFCKRQSSILDGSHVLVGF